MWCHFPDRVANGKSLREAVPNRAGGATVSSLFAAHLFRAGGWSYDASDGSRFIINRSGEEPGAAMTLVVNWDVGLKK